MEPAEVLLVVMAQQGDRDALNQLLRRVQDRLFRSISRILNSTGAAEDVLQETLLRIARKIRWLSEPAVFETWAYRIATREVFRRIVTRDERIARTAVIAFAIVEAVVIALFISKQLHLFH